jgi:hypothetical protein
VISEIAKRAYGMAVRPPSTINSWPVMNDEASLAKNAAA